MQTIRCTNRSEATPYNTTYCRRQGALCGEPPSTISLWPVERDAYGSRGVCIIQRPLGGKEYVVSDHLGSARVVVSDMGVILERKDYRPFGEVLATAGEGARTGYIAREEDGESGLGSYGVRLYEPEYGRFTSVDVMWEKFEKHQPFHYSFNAPVGLTDGTGLGPGDEYKSAKEAAYNWASNYSGESILRKVEIGSIIYSKQSESGLTVFSYTEPKYEDESESLVMDTPIPQGATEVAMVHAHREFRETNSEGAQVYPNEISGLKPNQSGGDAAYADTYKSDLFVTTPNGSMLFLDHKTMKTKTLSTDMPSDPRDPDRKNKVSPNSPDVKVGIPGVTVPAVLALDKN